MPLPPRNPSVPPGLNPLAPAPKHSYVSHVKFRVGGFLRPANAIGAQVMPMGNPLGPTVEPPMKGSTDPFRAFAGWLHAFVQPVPPSQVKQAIQPYVSWQTYNEPMPTRVIRLFNPHMRTFKGLKNYGGSNNFDSLYLPRVIRFNGRRSASPYAVQYLKGTKAVQSTVPIRSVFVPKGLQ